MRKADLVAILLKAAEISGRTEFVVVGSQAIHGTRPDAEIDVVIRSNDLDIYPVQGYGDHNLVYEELMLQLGQDSDFDLDTGTYIEAVPVTLARFPSDWEDRALRESVGSVRISGNKHHVTAVFPEIHDLVVSKLAIGREKDLEFLDGAIKLGLVDQHVLFDRYRQVPRTSQERVAEGLTEIKQAFEKSGDARR
jgi:hypothetical protein